VLLLGAPGVGKTTYISALSEFLTNLDRNHCIVNLDPANENASYEAGVDVQELIRLEDAMRELQLGPNGAMVYCMEFLERNVEWLEGKLLASEATYFIFDLPGQVELYTNHPSLRNLLKRLSATSHTAALHLVDASYLYDKHRFLSAMMLSLTAIISLEMPFLNAISKIDLIAKLGRPDCSLSFYQNCAGLNMMFFAPDEGAGPFAKKYNQMSKELCKLLENMNLVGFSLLDLEDKFAMAYLLGQIDKANGYFYAPERIRNKKELEIDYDNLNEYFQSEGVMDIEERYLN